MKNQQTVTFSRVYATPLVTLVIMFLIDWRLA